MDVSADAPAESKFGSESFLALDADAVSGVATEKSIDASAQTPPGEPPAQEPSETVVNTAVDADPVKTSEATPDSPTSEGEIDARLE